MRGTALGGLARRSLVGGIVMPLVVACLAAAPTTTTSPGPPVEVTIASAGGETTAFVPEETVVVATGPISLTFQNASSLSHNLTFVGITAATPPIVEPGATADVLLAPLAPGAYPFVCTIHDGMAGILTIRSA